LIETKRLTKSPLSIVFSEMHTALNGAENKRFRATILADEFGLRLRKIRGGSMTSWRGKNQASAEGDGWDESALSAPDAGGNSMRRKWASAEHRRD
jgi:hypothetical protein